MKNRLTALIIVIVICVMIFPVSAFADGAEPVTGECGELTWIINSGTLTISGSGKMIDFDDESAAPWYEYKGTFSSVVISDGITSVGEFAFKDYSDITQVSLSDDITDIGTGSFCNCSSISSLVIPSGVTTIADNAFSGCSDITSIRFCGAQPETVGSNAFAGITANVLYHHDYIFSEENYGGSLKYIAACNGSSYEKIDDEAVAPTCTEEGLSAGAHCSVCGETLSGRETIKALGHDLIHHEAKAPTLTGIGWEAYDTCSRCEYSTYKEIDMIDPDAEYALIYVLNGGENNALNPETYMYNSDTIIILNPEREGYVFAGWFLDEGFTDRITEITHGSFGTITLYAKWERPKGWNTIDGSRYYVLDNGEFATGWLKIDKEWYYFDTSDNKLLMNSWAKDSIGWCWMDADGRITKDKWIQYNAERYYLKSNGYMAANEWAKDLSDWYYMDRFGRILKNGWAKDSKGWCWMDADGRITKGKWIQYNGEWYYLKSNGYMAANEWAKDTYNWYYMSKSGRILKNGWAKDSKGWCWMDSNGRITKDKWIQYNGEWYYLRSNGYMAANEWAKDTSNWYFMNKSGRILKNGWAKDSIGWCWMDSNGRITKDKWIQYNGVWYCIKSNGYMAASEWAKDSKNWFFMDSNGHILKNDWAKDSIGWCWMDSSGEITKDEWIQYNGEWYYLKSNGYMAADEWAKDSTNWWYLKPDGSRDTNIEPVLQKAAAYVDAVTTSSMTKREKLRACFDSFRKLKEKNPWIPHYKGLDWPQKYANNLFDTKSGNCLSYAAAFAYMAKVLGYTNVYGCNSGGHGWVEIDGLIYDPEWTLHRSGNYFGRSYNESGGPGYKNVPLRTGPSWMYVRIS